jgi:carboxylesterase type B
MKIGLKIGVIGSHPGDLVLVGCAAGGAVSSWQLAVEEGKNACRRFCYLSLRRLLCGVETPSQLAEVLRTGEKSRFLTGLCGLSRE